MTLKEGWYTCEKEGRYTCDYKPLLADESADGYDTLRRIFNEATTQSSSGKGKERHHVDGELWEHQQICSMARRLGDNSGPLYQAVKKIYESKRLKPEQAKHELLGALVYTAAAIKLLEEQMEGGKEDGT